MKKDELKKLISQIRKYNLEKVFDTPDKFDNWLNNLNDKQLKNFNNLNIEPNYIRFSKNVLINLDLLNCDDFQNRIMALSTYRDANELCSINFLNSDSFYEDIEMLKKSKKKQLPLSIFSGDSFLKSPYHKEDLELILNAKDIEGSDHKLDWLVAYSLAAVASNIDSINGPYHREDMQLIAKSGSECLQQHVVMAISQERRNR